MHKNHFNKMMNNNTKHQIRSNSNLQSRPTGTRDKTDDAELYHKIDKRIAPIQSLIQKNFAKLSSEVKHNNDILNQSVIGSKCKSEARNDSKEFSEKFIEKLEISEIIESIFNEKLINIIDQSVERALKTSNLITNNKKVTVNSKQTVISPSAEDEVVRVSNLKLTPEEFTGLAISKMRKRGKPDVNPLKRSFMYSADSTAEYLGDSESVGHQVNAYVFKKEKISKAIKEAIHHHAILPPFYIPQFKKLKDEEIPNGVEFKNMMHWAFQEDNVS